MADRRTPGRMVGQASATGQPWWMMDSSVTGQPWRLTETRQEPEHQLVQQSGTERESEGEGEGQPWVRERVFRWV